MILFWFKPIVQKGYFIRFAHMANWISRFKASILLRLLFFKLCTYLIIYQCIVLLLVGLGDNNFTYFFIAVMALRSVTRTIGSKLFPMFSSANLLHSHATSFGWFISFSLSHWNMIGRFRVLPMLVFKMSYLIVYLNSC